MKGTAPDPRVGVAADRTLCGLDCLDDLDDPVEAGLTNLEVVPLSEALSRHWPTDAHVTGYAFPDEGSWPRINKSVYPALVLAGVAPVVQALFVDYDNPGHQPWAEMNGSVDGFLEAIAAAVAACPMLGRYRAAYATRNGTRFVYVLDRPIKPQDAESRHRGLVDLWRSHGVDVDQCSAWNHLFRLPHVVRDGIATWDDGDVLPFLLETQPGETLKVEDIPEERMTAGRVSGDSRVPIEPLDLEKPTPEECYALLWRQSVRDARHRQSDFYKRAKYLLKGRDCFPCIFEHQPLAPEGSRNDTIKRYTGQAVGLLFGRVDDITPAHVYALFQSPAAQLEPDADDPDWTDTVWRLTCRAWEHEDAQARTRAAEEADEEAARARIHIQMLEGVREWADVPEVRSDDRIAWEWVTRHMVVATPGGYYYLMRQDGYYDRLPVKSPHLLIRMRQIGMTSIIPTTVPVGENRERPMNPQEIVDRYGCLVSCVEGFAGSDHSHLGRVETDRPSFALKLYARRTDLEPRYDLDVDYWLRTLFGSQYEKGCAWIGHALAFDEGPIAALSLKGPPGSGKKMLVQGLTECIDTGAAADSSVFGQFNGSLMNSPFVWVNEGWPAQGAGGASQKDRADSFRHMVGGDAVTVNEKHKPLVTIRAPLRVILTANNLDVVSAVFSHRDMSPEDREALSSRILHIDGDAAAKLWLTGKGGVRFTGAKGRRWIRGDAGQSSDHVVARHFLYLHAVRNQTTCGDRFLVAGQMPEDLIRSMSTRSGKSPLVVEALIHMIEVPQKGQGISIDSTEVFVTTKGVLETFRNVFAEKAGEKLTVTSVSSALDGLTLSESKCRFEVRKTARGLMRARWRKVDLEILLHEAISHGYSSAVLQGMVDALRTATAQGIVNQ